MHGRRLFVLQDAQHADLGSSETHTFRASRHQRQVDTNIWAGTLGDHFIGPQLLPTRINGSQYLLLLRQRQLVGGHSTTFTALYVGIHQTRHYVGAV